MKRGIAGQRRVDDEEGCEQEGLLMIMRRERLMIMRRERLMIMTEEERRGEERRGEERRGEERR